MQPWSKGEKGIAWLGAGVALAVVAPVAFDGAMVAVAVVIGVAALAYGAWTAWQGMRKTPGDDAPVIDEVQPPEPEASPEPDSSDTDTDPDSPDDDPKAA